MQIYEHFHFDQFTLLLFPLYPVCLAHIYAFYGNLEGEKFIH